MNFFFKGSVVSYVFLYGDFGENILKILSCTVFTQIGNLCMERVKPGENVYIAYFGVTVGNQDKSWAPHRVCSSCVEGLCMWSEGKVESFRFECAFDKEGAPEPQR